MSRTLRPAGIALAAALCGLVPLPAPPAPLGAQEPDARERAARDRGAAESGVREGAARERAAPPFSVEAVLGSAFPSELVRSPTGDAVAWVREREGIRNVWVARAPGWEGRPVTSYEEDDGIPLSDLAFTPDGQRLVYVRGGDRNRAGEHPNPTSDPDGAEQSLWLVPVAGGGGGAPRDGEEAAPDPGAEPRGAGDTEPRHLAEGDSPAISPTGERVAFLRGGDVWSVPLDATDEGGAEPTGEDPEPAGDDPERADRGREGAGEAAEEGDEEAGAERMFRIRGRAGDLRWSPDGRRLAFVSRRGDHAFVGVYDVEADELRWMDPGVDRDGEPVWSPDGRRVAFVRVPNEKQRLPFAPEREALPWSIRVADAESGRSVEVWRAERGPGSAFRGVESDAQLWWTRDGRLVFPWERDGWTHLYSIPADADPGGPDGEDGAAGGEDGAATPLTPGEFEVEHVSLAADGRSLLYSSNQGDIDRRHLWRVAAAGGPPEAITSGRGIEWSPVPTAEDGPIAFLASDARHPARAELLRPGGGRETLVANPVPEDFPLERLVVPEAVTFPATDGLRIHGQLFLPPEDAPGADAGGRRPAVLFFHGGSRRQMLLGWHYRGYYHNAYALNQTLASRGFVVLSVNYRSGIGYGMEFREAVDYGARGASEYRDVLGAAEYLRGRDDVDPARIGLWGGSYGGYLTALGLARDSDTFAAGVDLHGVHDWNVVINNFVPSYSPEEREEAARLAFESSPMADIDGWRSPVLLIHGDDDRNVPFSESVDLAEALRRRDVHLETLVFPDEVHGFLLHRNWLAAYRATADFFARTLGAPEARTTDRR